MKHPHIGWYDPNFGVNFDSIMDAIEALKERETLAEISKRYEVHPNMISKWKQEFLERAGEIFEKKSVVNTEVDLEKLYSKIGQLEMQNDFLKKNLKKIGL